MENENYESWGCGCGVLILIAGAIFFVSGFKWGVAVFFIGFFVSMFSAIHTNLKIKEREKEREKVRKYKERHDQNASKLFEILEKNSKKSPKVVNVEAVKKYKYSIKAMDYCDINDSMLGEFIGCARTLEPTSHDLYPIVIYRGNKCIGYLPAGNEMLYSEIKNAGGSVGVEGHIAKSDDAERTYYYGKVKLSGLYNDNEAEDNQANFETSSFLPGSPGRKEEGEF